MNNELQKCFEDTQKRDIELEQNNVLINNSHLIHENINASKIGCVSNKVNDMFGINNKMLTIYQNLNITNELICESNEIYELIKNKSKNIHLYNSYYFSKYRKLNEYIIHDLKTTSDELISICWLLNHHEIPDKILINSIGDYFSGKDKDFNVFSNFSDFLSTINDIDNAMKHSYIRDVSLPKIGKYNNCIFVDYIKNGKINTFKEMGYQLDELINDFNSFFKYSEEYIQNKSKELK